MQSRTLEESNEKLQRSFAIIERLVNKGTFLTPFDVFLVIDEMNKINDEISVVRKLSYQLGFEKGLEVGSSEEYLEKKVLEESLSSYTIEDTD